MEKNILDVWASASTAQRLAGAQWYPKASQTVRALAWAHERSVAQVAGAVSALSPSNRWENNLTDAAMLLQGQRHGFRTYSAQVLKAVECMAAPSIDAALNILGGPKTRAFAKLLYDPSCDEVVVDGHAWSIALGWRLPLSACKVSPAAYRRTARAYRTAAEHLGELPSVVQATTWVVWRDRHGIT